MPRNEASLFADCSSATLPRSSFAAALSKILSHSASPIATVDAPGIVGNTSDGGTYVVSTPVTLIESVLGIAVGAVAVGATNVTSTGVTDTVTSAVLGRLAAVAVGAT
jgi:hypothetical protein